MEKIQKILLDIQDFFTPLWKWIIKFVSLITGFSSEYTQKFLLFTLGLIILLLSLQRIKKKIHKKVINLRKKLIEVYDKIFYLLAKKEYIQKLNHQQFTTSPSVKILQTIMKSKDTPNYFNSRELIKDNVKDIEVILGGKLISDDNRKQIDHRFNSIVKINFFTKLILGLQIIAIGFYIYLLMK